MYSRWDFKQVFEDQTVDIVQPDLSHAGGITECKKIADMAEAYDAAIAPHCPLGPIALASCIQVDVCSPNALVQEPGPSQPQYDAGSEDLEGLDYLSNPEVFSYDDGYVDAPTDPGLGIDPDEEFIREQAHDVDWHNDVYRNPDGSVSEW
jgi:galactonate dehydratase